MDVYEAWVPLHALLRVKMNAHLSPHGRARPLETPYDVKLIFLAIITQANFAPCVAWFQVVIVGVASFLHIGFVARRFMRTGCAQQGKPPIFFCKADNSGGVATT
jgi:hypothetical protein